MPQKIFYKKAVNIWNVDEPLFQKDQDELVFEFTRCNQWLKVSKVLMLTNGYHIKIECDNVRMANHCLGNDVLMYSFCYPPSSQDFCVEHGKVLFFGAAYVLTPHD